MRETKILTRILSVLGAVLLCIVLLVFVPHFDSKQESQVGKLTEWRYVTASGESVGFTLPQKLHQDLSGNIELFTVLPEDFAEPQMLCFWTFYQSVEVYLDEDLIYSYNNSGNGSFGEASSSRWNFVSLPDGEAGGKRLTIRTHTPYDDINFRLAEVVYGTPEQVFRWLQDTFGILEVLDYSFMWVGVLFVLLALIQKVDKRHRLYQVYSGIILFLFSTYLRTGTKELPIYWMSDYIREFLCFFCLLMLPIPLTLYIRTRVMRKPKMVRWCSILASLEMAAAVISLALHALNICDLHNIMGVVLSLLFITVITGIVFSVYYCIWERSRLVPLTVVSLLLVILMLTAEYVQFYQLSTLPFDTGFLSHLIAILIILVEAISYMSYLVSESNKQHRVAEEHRNLQLQLLTSQIRPHFILNTIGAIRNLIYEDADRASDLLYQFSKYIRNNLEQKNYTKPIPFLEELDYIETYLALERVRFEDRINVEYDIKAREFWVLPLTVQPFVENAIKHGLFPSKNGGTVRITTRDFGTTALIRIQDNGVGFNTALLKQNLEEKKSVGMRSAMMRLEKEMGAAITIQSSTDPRNSGTCIDIEIPVRKGKQS